MKDPLTGGVDSESVELRSDDSGLVFIPELVFGHVSLRFVDDQLRSWLRISSTNIEHLSRLITSDVEERSWPATTQLADLKAYFAVSVHLLGAFKAS